jgi:hypothetical protein
VVFPNGAVFCRKPVLLLRQPIWLIGARLGDKVNIESCCFENLEWMQGFGDE